MQAMLDLENDAADVEDLDDVDDVEELEFQKLSGAELRKRRKERIEAQEATRRERLARRVQARRSDKVEVVNEVKAKAKAEAEAAAKAAAEAKARAKPSKSEAEQRAGLEKSFRIAQAPKALKPKPKAEAEPPQKEEALSGPARRAVRKEAAEAKKAGKRPPKAPKAPKPQEKNGKADAADGAMAKKEKAKKRKAAKKKKEKKEAKKAKDAKKANGKNKREEGEDGSSGSEEAKPKKGRRKWQVRATALGATDGLSLPLPLADMAAANAALQGQDISFYDERPDSSSDSASKDNFEESGESGGEVEGSGEVSEEKESESLSSISSSSLSPSSVSSGAMRMAKELAEGLPSFSWERPMKLQAAEDFSLQPIPMNAGPQFKFDKNGNGQVETFLLASQVDADAAARLRCLHLPLQLAVVNQGAILGVRNPSSVLLARIRDAEMGRLPDAPPKNGTQITPSMLLPCKDKEVEACINKYQLDMRAAGMIRALPADERRKVLQIDFASSRNPSALVVNSLSGGGHLNADSPFLPVDPSSIMAFPERAVWKPSANGML